jgi:predicted nucleic acid-binding protein
VTVAVDTSVAVPLLVRSHQHHAEVVRWWGGQELALSGRALAETYSVLTRLPGDARLSAEDAARLLDTRFVHTEAAPAAFGRRPVETEHPVVRVHSETVESSLGRSVRGRQPYSSVSRAKFPGETP